jgi:hypothetical protein
MKWIYWKGNDNRFRFQEKGFKEKGERRKEKGTNDYMNSE